MSPGEIDPQTVRRHLLALDEALQTLRKHRGLTVSDLTSVREKRWIVERGLQLCAQNVLDIATHIAAGTGHDVPDYAAAIDCLTDSGVLPAEFTERFRALAGFRNVLVHGYLDVDVAVVHRLLNDDLEDFTEFARHVNRFIKTDSG
jgi:uncharacterized protein YutE (UPF0331/DUF86 family)